ncbi:hypothetical protein [Streptomyces sp. WAC07061]|nr:hypothetical protein [Streptomyces sp. WAC07061]
MPGWGAAQGSVRAVWLSAGAAKASVGAAAMGVGPPGRAAQDSAEAAMP